MLSIVEALGQVYDAGYALGVTGVVAVPGQPLPPPPPPAGNGLYARYYVGTNLDELKAAGVDEQGLSHDWLLGGPVPAVGTDQFSVRWTGQVRAEHSGEYQFRFHNSDDGVRLRVNGVTIIDDWTAHAPRDSAVGTATLAAGQLYDIEVDYFDDTLGARMELQWAFPPTHGF